jgi:predicted transposase/invertase (TIGR01784 family)
MTPEERANYSYYQKKLYSDRDELAAAEVRGIEKGETKKAVEIAKAMLTKNKPMEEIVEFTGLTVKEIEKLK